VAEPQGAFDRDTAVRPAAEIAGGVLFDAEVAEGWHAGRGPHGGYLAAMILRALSEANGAQQPEQPGEPARSARSLTIHFLRAPEPGAVTIEAHLERAGRRLSSLSARMLQGERTVALALAAFSPPWQGPEVSELSMPEVEPPGAGREPGALIAPEQGGPEFGRYITTQRRFGGTPFAAASQPMETGGWIGLLPPRAVDALSLAFFTDALIPTPFLHTRQPAPAPTIDITIHFRTSLPRPPAAGRPLNDTGELVLARARARLIHEGFFEEDVLIWGADGTLLAQSRQLALMLG